MRKLWKRTRIFARRAWDQRPFRRFRQKPVLAAVSDHAPSFLKKAVPGSYRFIVSSGFRFYDGYNAPGPYFILRDAKNRNRFMLRFREENGHFFIFHVQRNYSRLLRRLAMFFSGMHRADRMQARRKETVDSNALKEQLGSHPAEFLVNGFLYWLHKRGVALSNVRWVDLAKTDVNTQSPIRERFFHEVEADENGRRQFAISLSKRRVKEIIESE